MAGFEDINLHHFTFTYSALIIKPIFCLFPLTLYLMEEIQWSLMDFHGDIFELLLLLILGWVHLHLFWEINYCF